MSIGRRRPTTLAAAALALAASLAAGAPQTELERVAQHAIAAREKLLQEDATAADLDAFLLPCTDDLVYEDPVVKVRIEGKDRIREGMLGFLGATRRARIVVTKRMAAANLVVFEQRVTFESKQDDGGWSPQSRDQVTTFEFDGPRIRRIADYWSRSAPLAAVRKD